MHAKYLANTQNNFKFDYADEDQESKLGSKSKKVAKQSPVLIVHYKSPKIQDTLQK